MPTISESLREVYGPNNPQPSTSSAASDAERYGDNEVHDQPEGSTAAGSNPDDPTVEVAGTKGKGGKRGKRNNKKK